jgi:hypothetical protein
VPHVESQISMMTRTDNDEALLRRFVDHALSFAGMPQAARLPQPAASMS